MSLEKGKVGFTPGPWLLETHHRPGHSRMIQVWYVKASNDVGIAVQPSFSSPVHEEANARLIAAAPTMYAALERANQFITNGIELGFIRMPDPGSDDPALETPDIISAALKSARGE